MQSEKTFTKYLKAQDDSDQLRRALTNLIKQGVGGDYKPVVALAEALIMLNLPVRRYIVVLSSKRNGQHKC